MERPTCGDCPYFVPGSGCHHGPPVAQPVGADADLAGRPRLRVLAVFPPVTPETPACSHHPRMAGHVRGASARTPGGLPSVAIFDGGD